MNRSYILLVGLILLVTTLITAQAQNGPPTVEQVRANINRGASNEPLPDVFRTEVRKIGAGADSIPIQIYYPSNERNLPIIYNIHGGAFIMKALDGRVARMLCTRTQSVVVSVDYRVAPEHPFPASVDDCYAVWNWIAQNAGSLGGDPKKITLHGDSAGGLFMGSLQVKRQQTGQPERPLALVFVNPGIDLRPTAAGADEYALVTKWYLNGADPNDPLASPILADNFGDYPQSLIITSEKDEIRQHGILLNDKLKAAGVATQLLDIPGIGHLAHQYGGSSPTVQVAIDTVVAYLNSVNGKPVR